MHRTAIIAAGQTVVADLRQVERDIDASIQGLASVMSNMITVRRETGLPLNIGHRALVNFADAAAQMIDLRGKIIDGHVELSAIRSDVPVIRHMMYGDWTDTPNASIALPPTLAAVA